VVAIYPKEGTFWSDHPAGVVEREWVTASHRDAAKIYLDYLLAKPQQEKAIPYGFRPASVEVPLASPLDAAHGVDPKEPKTTLEVPSVDVMDAIIKLWHQSKKHANVTLVLDTSGSMNEGGRMENARAGSLQFVSILGDDDQFSLLPFNSTPNWAVQAVPLKQGREQINNTLKSLYASSGTALYDSIAAAYDAQLASRDRARDKISAIVVLTDGADTDSHLGLDALLDKIRFDHETRTIRVFTIGYGAGAQKDILKKIAEATQAKFYEGKPENIRSVFKEISTFF
jgi:Ca-activated chloride channel family protein